MPGNGDLGALLHELKASAALPVERARACPPGVYHSKELHARELDRLFHQEWHCVGRVDEFAELGQYRCLTIGVEPIFVIRDGTNSLSAYSNICRHRSSALLTGEGRVQYRIVCPYHAWSYGLDGSLHSAPHMAEDFAHEECRLPAFPVETWEGWVYVSLDPKAPPLAPRLEGLSRRYANYRMADFRTLFRVEEIWETNWKILVENFIDPYHLFRVHSKTVEPVLPTRLTQPLPGEDAYTLFEQGRVPDVAYEHAGTMAASNEALTEEERNKVPIFCVFPAQTVSISPERLFWLAVQPEGTQKVRVRWGVDAFPGSLPEGGAGEGRIEELRQTFEQINTEDKSIIAAVRRNASSRYATAGRLSPKEQTIWEFQRYLAARLCD